MILKNNQIKIDDANIFLYDKLDREESIENLSKLIVKTKEPFVLSVNANWGAGKTTFIQLWKVYLKKQYDVNSIYFSAWKDDFSKEPLISILGELNSYINSNYDVDSEVLSGFDNVKSFTGKVIKRGLPALIKGSTAGVLDLDKGFESAIGAMTEQMTKELIENYSAEKEIIVEFKKSVHEVLSKIDSDKPFIIFIDELDRCRPLYAIELLERIKHVFGIDNLIFILSIDKKQLSESIKSQYGNIDTDNYLRRFIDLEYQLNNNNLDKFCDALYKKFNLDSILKTKGIKTEFGDFNHLNVIKKLVAVFKLSLRQVEQVFTKLHIIFTTIEPMLYESHFRIFVFFEILKSNNPEKYYEFINGKDIASEIKSMVLPFITSDTTRDISIIIEATIDATCKNDEEYSLLIKSKEKELLKIQDTSSLEYKKFSSYINLLKHTPDKWGEYTMNKLIETVIKKIEFVDRFNFEGE